MRALAAPIDLNSGGIFFCLAAQAGRRETVRRKTRPHSHHAAWTMTTRIAEQVGTRLFLSLLVPRKMPFYGLFKLQPPLPVT